MSTLIFLSTIILLLAGYFFYGRFIKNVVGVDSTRKTPALTRYDGIDYVPAKNGAILFGHHFASIAGAGPIVGPVFAYMYWGWIGVLVWIIFGSIFMGAVHDFISLFISVREGGTSIGQIAQKYISRRASIVFLIFLWCALVIVIAVFASICAKSFISQPKIVLPSLGLIPVAVLVGFLIYRLKTNTFFATILGLTLLTLLVFWGNQIPLAPFKADPYLGWLVILFVYAFFASVIPVNILLQPRDYISSFLLFFGITVSVIGIIAKPLPIASAHFFSFSSKAGPFFPLMFITVACGAISGFHSLVSSGTTSKQISSEAHTHGIGYGAMIVEALLAAIALACVAFGLKNIPQETTPVEAFALGFSRIVFFLGPYANFIALVILNAFILTTLDTATRITRFLTQELLGIKNKFLATAIVVLAAGYFCISGTWQTLWPLFGASNQLVAGLAFIVGSAYLIKNKKNCLVVLVPAIIMFFITLIALALESFKLFGAGKFLLFSLNIALVFLGIFIITEFAKKGPLNKIIDISRDKV